MQLLDSLNWRVQNDIDNILSKPILPSNLYRAIRDSHLVGMSGYSKEGLPIIAIGAGLSSFDKASVNYYVQSHIQMNEYRDRVLLPSATKKIGRHIGTCIKVLDMTGLRLSSLNHIKILTAISTIDELNYPEKTDTYYIVNAPYVFSACWKVCLLYMDPLIRALFHLHLTSVACTQAVRPLLQERTKLKVQVLPGSGKNELLKIMDYASLPHFCNREGSGSGSSRHSRNGKVDNNCFSMDHAFHQQLYNYIKQQAEVTPMKGGSVRVAFPEPDPDDIKISETIESEFQKLHGNETCNAFLEIKINGD
nr:SEC14 cytosolic factor [Ipomoea batatas]